jgi:hypothetical protein
MDCSSLKDACRAAEACVLSLDPEYVEDRRRWMRLTGRDLHAIERGDALPIWFKPPTV